MGPFQRVYFFGEQVYKWDMGPGQRRVPTAPPAMFWAHLLTSDGLSRALRGTLAERRVTVRQPNVYRAFIRGQLLPVLPILDLVTQV